MNIVAQSILYKYYTLYNIQCRIIIYPPPLIRLPHFTTSALTSLLND